MLLAYVTQGDGDDEVEPRRGETLYEGPTFLFVLPPRWYAVEMSEREEGASLVYLIDDDAEDARAHADELSPVSVHRTRRGSADPHQRAVNARRDARQVGFPVDVAEPRRLDGHIAGEEAWTHETAVEQPGGYRTKASSTFFAHDGSDYEIRVETREERFAFVDERVVARLIETWRWA